MDKEKLKLIIRNMEFLIDSLKVEIYSNATETAYGGNIINPLQLDYDEIFEDDE